jgi:hypothetical protein
MNIIDYIYIAFGGYAFSDFQIHTNHRIFTKVMNTPQLLEVIFLIIDLPH